MSVGICLILFLIYFSFEADYREIFLKYLKEFRNDFLVSEDLSYVFVNASIVVHGFMCFLKAVSLVCRIGTVLSCYLSVSVSLFSMASLRLFGSHFPQ